MKKISELINIYKFQILSFFAIFFLIYLLYYHTNSFDFIYFDDNSLIINRIDRMDSLFKTKDFILEPVFDENASKFYRPVLNLSFLIDTVISGGELGFYHFSNVLMHIIAVFLLLLFLTELGCSKLSSLAASLLFAVHPALTFAVAWVPGRNDILLAIFVLLTMIFFIKSIKSAKMRDFVLMSVFFILSLFTKETAIIIPIVFASYIFFYNKIGSMNKKNIVWIIITVIIPLLFYGIFRFLTLSQGSSEVNILKIIMNIIKSFGANIWYFGIIFLTEKVILFPQLNLHIQDLIGGFIPILIISGFCVFFRKSINFKHILFGLIWFAIFIIPTYAMGSSIYYTHRLYIPIIGILIVLIEIVSTVYKTYPKIKLALYTFFAVLLIFMLVMSYKQSFYYKDRASFWLKAYEENPSSSVACTGVSKYYMSINNLEKAEEFALKALNKSKSKDTSILISNLALIKHKKGENQEAEELYKKALDSGLKSKYDEYSYTGLSKIYEDKNDIEKALSIIDEGLSVMPNSNILKKYKKDLIEGNDTEQYVIIMKYEK